MAADRTTGATSRPPLNERLAGNPDGILEQIAREYGVSTLEVVRQLPPENRTIVAGNLIIEIMQEVTTWGDILFIVHTADIVLECKGPLPPGTLGHGYFNLHGESPIAGHIRAENCQAIAFVSRPFMARPSRSLQFFNQAGEAMFKIFVRRDQARNLIAEQVERFDRLRNRLQSEATCPG
ncbi:MAG TPA: heme utilization cystosolic carrier protein HutX [Hyphomicrobiaceae bacterium]|nr:heme utilization cystosolic carrier protein HutX [Hyphomicrobiaceae bacterium]